MGQAESRETPDSGDSYLVTKTTSLGRPGRVLHVAVLAVVAVVSLKTFALDSFQVVSSSMMPNLVGPNLLFVCPATGEEFRLPANESPHALQELVCPRCGAVQESGEQTLRAGDKLLVDRATFQFRAPRRFESVVLRHLRNDGKLETVVKRIVGLPGETVQIIDGDVFVDGHRLQKSLAELKRFAVTAVDFQHLAQAQRARQSSDKQNPAWPTVWRWPHAATWEANRSSFVIDNGEFEFGGEVGFAAQDAINQLFTVRADQMPPVADLMVTIEKLRVFPKKMADGSEPELIIRLSNRQAAITFVLQPKTGNWTATRADEELAAGTIPELRTRLQAGLSVDLAIVDGTFQAAVQTEPLFRLEFKDGEAQVVDPEKIIQISANGCRAELEGLLLSRDLSYSTPSGLGPRSALDEPFQLGADEYFVLGDNSAISDDSRFWLRPGVSRDQILGRPVLVHWPAEGDESWGGWIQVPSPDKIRYIR